MAKQPHRTQNPQPAQTPQPTQTQPAHPPDQTQSPPTLPQGGKGDIFAVVCEGDYYAFVNGQKTLLPYTVTVHLDEQAKKAGFLSVIRNEVLGNSDAMRRLYPNWKRFRRHVITQVINVTRQNAPVRELALMNRSQIVNYINAKGLPIDSDLYPDVSELRQAMRDYREDRQQFLKLQEKRRQFKGPLLAVRQTTSVLNPWLYENTPNSQTQSQTQGQLVDEQIQQEQQPEMELELDSIPEFDEQDEFNALVDGSLEGV